MCYILLLSRYSVGEIERGEGGRAEGRGRKGGMGVVLVYACT